jgi:hypothetical protein
MPILFSIGYHYCGGFPHSDIDGSTVVRTSPPLFAAYHVLLRLLAPRHPPNALNLLERYFILSVKYFTLLRILSSSKRSPHLSNNFAATFQMNGLTFSKTSDLKILKPETNPQLNALKTFGPLKKSNLNA